MFLSRNKIRKKRHKKGCLWNALLYRVIVNVKTHFNIDNQEYF